MQANCYIDCRYALWVEFGTKIRLGVWVASQMLNMGPFKICLTYQGAYIPNRDVDSF